MHVVIYPFCIFGLSHFFVCFFGGCDSLFAEFVVICFCRTPGLSYQKVHCSYKSLGQSLMPNGEVDNFIIPCFCRMLFEERHPASSGRHYFFPHIGVSLLAFHRSSSLIVFSS